MITIICGSPSGKSRTLNYAEEIAKGTGLSYQVHAASDWNILPCRGCHQCFEKGRCIQSGKDDFPELLSDLCRSDGIIFASPVYAGTVTGQMKLLIDRMSVLLHEMPLIGIPSVLLTSSSGNHLKETLAYLKNVMEWMGSSVVPETAVRTGLNGSAKNQELLQALRSAAEALRRAIDDPAVLPVSEGLESHFRHQNRRYQSLIPTLEFFPNLFGEAAVWKKQGYDRCESIRDVIAMKAKKRISPGGNVK